MYFFEKPEIIQAETVFRLPESFRKKGRTAWSDPNRLGAELDSFLEGPSFDHAGNLYFVDIPFGLGTLFSKQVSWLPDRR